MATEVFQRPETIPIWAETKTWAGVYDNPNQGIQITITDPDGVVKAGIIFVVSSASFTIGLKVTGGTSGATGVIIEKPSATELEVQQVTGVWKSGEAITDTGTGASTTTSALTAAPMTNDATGKYVYYYNPTDSATLGWWRYSCKAQDGLLEGAKYTVADGSFKLA
jgi:hypothetical protein